MGGGRGGSSSWPLPGQGDKEGGDVASLPSLVFCPWLRLFSTNMAPEAQSTSSPYVQMSHGCLSLHHLFQDVVLKIPVPLRAEHLVFRTAAECFHNPAPPSHRHPEHQVRTVCFAVGTKQPQSSEREFSWEPLAHVASSPWLGGVAVPRIFSKTGTDKGSEILKLLHQEEEAWWT